MKKIQIDAVYRSHLTAEKGWPLAGASDYDQLNTVVGALRQLRGDLDEVAGALELPRPLVANVARLYQSLWLRP